MANSDVRIGKIDEQRNLVFGWANVAITKDGEQISDRQGHQIDVEELENAAYVFNLAFRKSGADHQGDAIGQLIESLVVTPEKLTAMGLAKNALPQGWWIGFYIEDDAVFEKVKTGDYEMFSIQGRALLEPVAG